jgi:diguanylate cyclase (GGDEF)-like protein/PAS domain S-box-containing protein
MHGIAPIAASTDSTDVGTRSPAAWLGPLALFALSTVATLLSVRLTRFGGGVSSLWVANGLLTGAMLLTARRSWPRWLLAGGLGQALGRSLHGDPGLMTFGLTIANLIECGIVAFWIRRNLDDLRLARSLGTVSRDAVLSTLAACAVSASFALAFLPVGSPTLDKWLTWYSAHVLGMVIVATLTVCAFQARVHPFGEAGRRREYLFCIALLAVTCWLTFAQQRYPLLFLPFLPLLLLAYRHDLTGMLVGVLMLALASGGAAAHGLGPFALVHTDNPVERVLFWQVYIAAGCVLAFSTAVALTQRRQLERRIQRGEARLLAITENLPAMVALFDKDVRYVYANSRSRAMVPGVELIGRSLPELRGPEHYGSFQEHVDAVLRGETQVFDTFLMRPEGRVDLRAQFVPDRAPDGSVQGFYSLSFDITEQLRLERELERMARVDALTGLANRRQFDEALAQAVARAARTGAPLMLLSLDLDRFKHINDSLGHGAGDEVLKEFGRRVQAAVYNVDMVARLGGDEFMVLVEYSANEAAGARMAAHIIEAMQPPIALSDGGSVQAATSIGIGLQQPVASAGELLALADKALYEAKAHGRNTWKLLKA